MTAISTQEQPQKQEQEQEQKVKGWVRYHVPSNTL